MFALQRFKAFNFARAIFAHGDGLHRHHVCGIVIVQKRIDGAEQVGSHKTSMLQDVELGRSLEIEALVGAVLELAEITEIPAPSIEAVYACVKLLNKTMLLEGGGLRINNAA